MCVKDAFELFSIGNWKIKILETCDQGFIIDYWNWNW
jgi:hypothetical protein